MACFAKALNHSRNNRCPHCRAENCSLSSVTLIQDNVLNSKNKKVNKLPFKRDVLINMIKQKPDGKFLVFSQFSNSFNTIVEKLTENNITFSKLSGSTGRVTNIIRDFSNNKIKVLLLNANNYGSGLNLEMTTDIVIYHKMSHDLEEQIIGRGQRLGRTSPLHIHYLCYENEYKKK